MKAKPHLQRKLQTMAILIPAETAAGVEWSWESSYVPCRGQAGEVGQAKSVGTQKTIRPQTWSSTSRLWFALNLIFYALVNLFGNRKGYSSDFTQVAVERLWIFKDILNLYSFYFLNKVGLLMLHYT